MRAHLLNDSFQTEMSKLFLDNIDNVVIEEKGIDFGVDYVYHDAPVKLRERCIVKSESDYNNEPFPNTALSIYIAPVHVHLYQVYLHLVACTC